MAARETFISKDRLLSLDVFRGLTIAGMILVNSPGNQTAYAPLDHSEWNGCTPTDLVFPFFVFIVGVSLVFSFTKRLERGETRVSLLKQVFRRTAVIFGLGLLLNGFPYYQPSTIRLLGVLQRIALCYLFASLIYLVTRKHLTPSPVSSPPLGERNRQDITEERNKNSSPSIGGRGQRPSPGTREAGGRGSGWSSAERKPGEGGILNEVALLSIMVGLLVGHWLLMTGVPVPGYGIGNLTKEGNLAAFIDKIALTPAHMYRAVYDPEGILSTLPAIGTTLLGVFTGLWLQSQKPAPMKCRGMLCAGLALTIGGQAWGLTFPINKALWTSSYVLLTGGMALILLAACHWLIEIKGLRRWAWPFEAFGVNAIAAYVLHIVFLKIQNLIPMARSNGTAGNLRLFISDHLFGGWASPANASLLYALAYTSLWLAFFTLLYRKRIFIKI